LLVTSVKARSCRWLKVSNNEPLVNYSCAEVRPDPLEEDTEPLSCKINLSASDQERTASSFRYFDKGNLAVVGKNFAVLQSGRVMMSGFLAWLVWALCHIQFWPRTTETITWFLQ